MGSYKRLLVYIKPYIGRLIFGLICMIIAAAAYLVVPWLIKNVVDDVLQAKRYADVKISSWLPFCWSFWCAVLPLTVRPIP